jgi:hypothetical protein
LRVFLFSFSLSTLSMWRRGWPKDKDSLFIQISGVCQLSSKKQKKKGGKKESFTHHNNKFLKFDPTLASRDATQKNPNNNNKNNKRHTNPSVRKVYQFHYLIMTANIVQLPYYSSCCWCPNLIHPLMNVAFSPEQALTFYYPTFRGNGSGPFFSHQFIFFFLARAVISIDFRNNWNFLKSPLCFIECKSNLTFCFLFLFGIWWILGGLVSQGEKKTSGFTKMECL